ncbi:uracil-DNA glycosylase [Pseudomonas profundi]|uniref:uracil-DNA glycosylase n=1 Tax=Pseudomonas profundi TaxID=1981513 RepID=UPI001CC238E0|nr:uracil-DNA glycosylase [Pseudomonas profundi]
MFEQKLNNWRNTTCVRCSNLFACRTQIVVASACPSGGLLAVGEAPGADEDIKGEGFVGAAGKTLNRLLADHGIEREAYGRANICRCRPPENRKPTAKEITACLPFLADLIESCRPRVILAVGGTPTSIFCGPGSLYSKILERERNNDWRAFVGAKQAHKEIKDALGNVLYVIPMPHTSPLAFNRNAPSGEKWSKIAERQVALAVSLLD